MSGVSAALRQIVEVESNPTVIRVIQNEFFIVLIMVCSYSNRFGWPVAASAAVQARPSSSVDFLRLVRCSMGTSSTRLEDLVCSLVMFTASLIVSQAGLPYYYARNGKG